MDSLLKVFSCNYNGQALTVSSQKFNLYIKRKMLFVVEKRYSHKLSGAGDFKTYIKPT